MSNFQHEKTIVRTFMDAFDGVDISRLESTLSDYTKPSYTWRGMHPFYQQASAQDVVANFWVPLRKSLTSMQRREDIFFSGQNIYVNDDQVWTCSMGHFMGLFDQDWLEIPATHKMAFLPYAEFHRIEDGMIAESALFIDVIRVMQQAGCDPFPHQTAAAITQPGPQTHDGIMLGHNNAAEATKTINLLEEMISDLSRLNLSGNNRPPPAVLERTWHHDMLWYGPAGIGSTYTIPRYQEQHQYPFRQQLGDKTFNGHVTRFAEGNYAGWFGWPNLNNRNLGGFLGLPESDVLAEMRVVDIYRRDGDKLAENWVFIDILYYLMQHGINLLKNPNAVKDLYGASKT